MRVVLLIICAVTMNAVVAEDSPLVGGILEATGFGTVSMERVNSKAQAKMMARRAAKVDAQRNLLEMLEGVRITSGTTVKDFQLESDLIANRVKGMLRGAFVTKESIQEEEGTFVAEIEMAVCLNSKALSCKSQTTLTQIVHSTLQQTPEADKYQPAPQQATTPPAEQASASQPETVAAAQPQGAAAVQPEVPVSTYTGLIIDVSKQQFSPYLDVRVKTSAGKELYGPGNFDPEQGGDWLHWARNVDSAKSMQDVIGTSPLVVAATNAAESDIIVSDDDAVDIFKANVENGDFLKQGKVIFVVQ
jgi:hypothetical protein|tara:strand:- start:1584 stop:2495 length:912 start_codon:yes stop_codon:yes gene_type:complete